MSEMEELASAGQQLVTRFDTLEQTINNTFQLEVQHMRDRITKGLEADTLTREDLLTEMQILFDLYADFIHKIHEIKLETMNSDLTIRYWLDRIRVRTPSANRMRRYRQRRQDRELEYQSGERERFDPAKIVDIGEL